MTGPIIGGLIATFLGMKYVFFVAGFILLGISRTIRRKKRQSLEAA
jgi:DHA1 family multidrug resistance protein-like MFS transporter